MYTTTNTQVRPEKCQECGRLGTRSGGDCLCWPCLVAIMARKGQRWDDNRLMWVDDD